MKKYLTLSKCDLFFADKAIFIEGASERLLIPDMIKKCDQKGYFTTKHKLTTQYYTLIEVGVHMLINSFRLRIFLEFQV